jgi:bacterioferritin-associated ferredoxin
MYICICNTVTDRDIRACIAEGARSMRDLREHLNVATQCGRCACHARSLLEESLAVPRAANDLSASA